METNYYGLNQSFIYRKDLLKEFKKVNPHLPCIWEKDLTGYDIIYNDAYELFYIKEEDAFKLMTNDPARFLPYEAIFKLWTYR